MSTEYRRLQAQCKELGIGPCNKSAAVLRRKLAAAGAPDLLFLKLLFRACK